MPQVDLELDDAELLGWYAAPEFSKSQNVGLLIAEVDFSGRYGKTANCFTAGSVTCNIEADAYDLSPHPHSGRTGKIMGYGSYYSSEFSDVYTSATLTYDGVAFDGWTPPNVTDVEDSSLRSLSWLKENVGFDDSVWVDSADGIRRWRITNYELFKCLLDT